jgi:hypothetical protein
MFPNVTVEAVPLFQKSEQLSRRARIRRRVGNLLRTIVPPVKSPRALPAGQMPAAVNPYYPFYCLKAEFVDAVERHFIKGCDIFQAEFAEMASLGPFMAGRVPTIFVHHQLHFVYARRFLEANDGVGANKQYLTARMILEEAAYLDSFDSAIVFSGVDRTALNSFCPTLEISVSPFPSPEEPMSAALSFNGPVRRFVFVASEIHHPNVDGLRWFMKDVWPTIKRRLPDASIEVIGRWSQSAQSSLPNHEDIHFKGFVPELVKSLQNAIMIVPVWVGSGIRTKILAAWSASCPVITTSVGAEGLPGASGEHFIVANDAGSFSSACIEASGDLKRLNRMAANGLRLVQEHYSLEAVRKTRLDAYAKLLALGHYSRRAERYAL